MKKLLLLHSYSKGARFNSLLLIIMMVISMLLGIVVIGQINYLRSSHDIIASVTDNPSEIYYYEQMFSNADYISGNLATDKSLSLIEELENSPAIQSVYTVKTANPLSYSDEGVTILLYDPELLDLFPELSQLGISFSESTSCVLGSRVFNDISVGEDIELTFYRPSGHQISFPVSGQLSYPYQYLTFSVSANTIYTEDFFKSGHIIIMEENEDTLAILSEITMILSGTNFLFQYSEDATEDQIAEVNAAMGTNGIIIPLSRILEDSENALQEACRERLPMPIFLLVVSCFAYFSTLLLIFKKKEYHFSICYLCGGSRVKCASIVLMFFSFGALIPVLICGAFVLAAPYLDWMGYINLDGYIIDWHCLILIGVCFLITQIIVLLTAWSQIRNHTPLSMLRGSLK